MRFHVGRGRHDALGRGDRSGLGGGSAVYGARRGATCARRALGLRSLRGRIRRLVMSDHAAPSLVAAAARFAMENGRAPRRRAPCRCAGSGPCAGTLSRIIRRALASCNHPGGANRHGRGTRVTWTPSDRSSATRSRHPSPGTRLAQGCSTLHVPQHIRTRIRLRPPQHHPIPAHPPRGGAAKPGVSAEIVRLPKVVPPRPRRGRALPFHPAGSRALS